MVKKAVYQILKNNLDEMYSSAKIEAQTVP